MQLHLFDVLHTSILWYDQRKKRIDVEFGIITKIFLINLRIVYGVKALERNIKGIASPSRTHAQPLCSAGWDAIDYARNGSLRMGRGGAAVGTALFNRP